MRCSSSTETTSKPASPSTTVGRVGARRHRRAADSIWSSVSGTSSPSRRIDARSESTDGARIDTEYPGRFSAMMSPFRS
jgi:hypothetical protein